MIYPRSNDGKPEALARSRLIENGNGMSWLPDDELRVYSEEFARTSFRGAHMVDGAGHWIQQEQPAALAELLINFLERET